MEKREELYKYISGILKNIGCSLKQINGIGNHIHILMEVHPSVSVADIMKKVKQGSSHWLKSNPSFPCFEGWGKGYFAVSVSPGQPEEACRSYIQNQVEHHRRGSFKEELQSLIARLGMDWYDEEWS